MQDNNENRLAYLQMVQAIIGRLAATSSVVKGWSVTLVAALFTVGVFTERNEVSFVALFPALIFWGLDAYYLRRERLFRNLYRTIHSTGMGDLEEPFSMDVSAQQTAEDGYFRVLLRPPLSVFHGAILLAVAAVIILVTV